MNDFGRAACVLALCTFQSQAGERTLTLEGQGVCEDGHAWSARPAEPRGSYYFIDARAWTWSGQGDGPGITRSFFSCDLGGLPRNARVLRAVLGLYQDPQLASTNANAQHSTRSGSNALVVQRITAPWSEQTISWNTQPTTTDRNQVLVPASTGPIQDYQIDVTALLKDAVDNHEPHLGLALKLVHETPYRAVVFSSNEGADPGAYPRLVITYETTAPGSPPVAGPQTPVDDDREPADPSSRLDRKPGADPAAAPSAPPSAPPPTEAPMIEWTRETRD